MAENDIETSSEEISRDMKWNDSIDLALEQNIFSEQELEALKRMDKVVITGLGSAGDTLEPIVTAYLLAEFYQKIGTNTKVVLDISLESVRLVESLGLFKAENCEVRVAPVNYRDLLKQHNVFYDYKSEEEYHANARNAEGVIGEVAEKMFANLLEDSRSSNGKTLFLGNGVSFASFTEIYDLALKNGAHVEGQSPHIFSVSGNTGEEVQHLPIENVKGRLKNAIFMNIMRMTMRTSIGKSLAAKYELGVVNYTSFLDKVRQIYTFPEFLSKKKPESDRDAYVGGLGIPPEFRMDLSEDTKTFLDTNDSVIAMSLGSMPMQDPYTVAKSIFRSLPDGSNVVFVAGWGMEKYLVEKVIADNKFNIKVRFTDFEDYSNLLKHENISLGIFAGGSGTAQRAMESGTAYISASALPDQQDNVRRLAEKGYPAAAHGLPSFAQEDAEVIEQTKRDVKSLMQRKSEAKAFAETFVNPKYRSLEGLPQIGFLKALAKHIIEK